MRPAGGNRLRNGIGSFPAKLDGPAPVSPGKPTGAGGRGSREKRTQTPAKDPRRTNPRTAPNEPENRRKPRRTNPRTVGQGSPCRPRLPGGPGPVSPGKPTGAGGPIARGKTNPVSVQPRAERTREPSETDPRSPPNDPKNTPNGFENRPFLVQKTPQMGPKTGETNPGIARNEPENPPNEPENRAVRTQETARVRDRTVTWFPREKRTQSSGQISGCSRIPANDRPSVAPGCRIMITIAPGDLTLADFFSDFSRLVSQGNHSEGNHSEAREPNPETGRGSHRSMFGIDFPGKVQRRASN
jgi:hypothetical protein